MQILYIGCPAHERAEAGRLLAAAALEVQWADTTAGALSKLQRRDMPVLLDLSRGAAALRTARTYRTRPDPFEGLWEHITACLMANPERTGVSIFQELQTRYPGRFPDVQVRTLQRGLGKVRKHLILQFDDHWMETEVINGQSPAPVLRAVAVSAAL
jgi:hypothetical protein